MHQPAVRIHFYHTQNEYSVINLINKSIKNWDVLMAAFSESETSYRTRSLPAWGKVKQRPVTITDDIATLYVKVIESL